MLEKQHEQELRAQTSLQLGDEGTWISLAPSQKPSVAAAGLCLTHQRDLSGSPCPWVMVPGDSSSSLSPSPGKQTAQHSIPGWAQHLTPSAKRLLRMVGGGRRWGTSRAGAGRHPAHLSGSRAETRSSCLHPRTPVARCPALLQERTQEQVTSLPIAYTMLQGTPRSLGYGGTTQLRNASQEMWDCQHLWRNSGRASSPHPCASWGSWGHPGAPATTGTHPSHPPAMLGTPSCVSHLLPQH